MGTQETSYSKVWYKGIGGKGAAIISSRLVWEGVLIRRGGMRGWADMQAAAASVRQAGWRAGSLPACSGLDLVHQGAPQAAGHKILCRGVRDVAQSLVGEEGRVRGDEHLQKRREAAEEAGRQRGSVALSHKHSRRERQRLATCMVAINADTAKIC